MKRLKLIAVNVLLSIFLLLPWLSAIAQDIPPQFFVPATPMQTASGNGAGYSFISKFGENPDIDMGGGFEDLIDFGGKYVNPTTSRIHDVASNNAADVGVVRSSGTATGGSESTLVDLGATFATDGVIAGDFVLNDDDLTLGRVLTVTSETSLFLSRMASPGGGLSVGINSSGESYRVVGAAGTGAGVMFLEGLNSTLSDFQREFVILNGVTNVPTIKSYPSMYRCRIFIAGSAGGAVGTVMATAQTDGTISCQVIDGNNQSQMTPFRVPRSRTGYLKSWWASISSKTSASSVVRLRAGEISGVSYVVQSRSIQSTGNSSFNYTFKTPLIIPGGAEIFIEADSDTNNTAISGGYELIMINNR